MLPEVRRLRMVARCDGTNPIHLGYELVGEVIRRRRLSDNGWWRLQQCIHLRPQRSSVVSVLCDGLGPVRLETRLEDHSLTYEFSDVRRTNERTNCCCCLFAPSRERLSCFRSPIDSLKMTRLWSSLGNTRRCTNGQMKTLHEG